MTIHAPELDGQVILAIDTAIGTSVALGAGAEVFTAASDDPRGHAEVIGTLIARVFETSGVSPAAVTGVVAGIGPGPFTGLRVGIAAAQAFAVGRGLEILPLHGHEAVALDTIEARIADTLHAAMDDGAQPALVRVVQDARRRELFVTEYAGLDAAGIPVRVAGPHIVTREAHVELPGELWPERIPAAALVRLAARRIAAGRPFESDRAVYLRAPDVKQPGAPKRVSV